MVPLKAMKSLSTGDVIWLESPDNPFGNLQGNENGTQYRYFRYIFVFRYSRDFQGGSSARIISRDGRHVGATAASTRIKYG